MKADWSEVVVPQLGVNDEYVTVVEWAVKAGAQVVRGQQIAILETSKVAYELEAESDGFLYPMVEAGREVPIRAAIAIVIPVADPSVVDRYRKSVCAKNKLAISETERAIPEGINLTQRARELAHKHNVNFQALPRNRIIRERDIIELVGLDRPLTIDADPFRRIVIYGASKGGLTILECLKAMGAVESVAFVDDDPEKIGTLHGGLPVRSGDELPNFEKEGVGAIAIAVADRDARLEILKQARNAGLVPFNVIHPSAYIAVSAKIGQGNFIKPRAIIETEVQIGDCCIIDNGVIISHHSIIESGCHLAPGAVLGSSAHIGRQTLIGIGAVVVTGVRVGQNVIIGPSASVVRDIPDNVVAEGMPARVVGKRR